MQKRINLGINNKHQDPIFWFKKYCFVLYLNIIKAKLYMCNIVSNLIVHIISIVTNSYQKFILLSNRKERTTHNFRTACICIILLKCIKYAQMFCWVAMINFCYRKFRSKYIISDLAIGNLQNHHWWWGTIRTYVCVYVKNSTDVL